MAIKPQERTEWTHHPVTVELVDYIKQAIEEAKEFWSKEEFVGETPELSLAKNAKALGGIQSLRSVLDVIDGYKQPVEEQQQ